MYERHGATSLDAMFTEAFAKESQLIRCNPRDNAYLACALLCRGDVSISAANRNVARVKEGLRMAHWNEEGFKVGICAQPSLSTRRSLLCLANNCGIRHTLRALRNRAARLFGARAHLHHYESFGLEQDDFEAAFNAVDDVVTDYRTHEKRTLDMAGGGERDWEMPLYSVKPLF